LPRKLGIFAFFLGMTAGLILVQGSTAAPSFADHDPTESHDSMLSEHGEASHLDIYSAYPEEFSHRDTFATLVERKEGDLTVSVALIMDKVPGVASRYVTRDLPSLLENHSPFWQIKRELSPGLPERGVPGPEDKKEAFPGSIEPGNAFLNASGGDGGK
jgi:hypothetical protein